jgi:hypothetical protein
MPECVGRRWRRRWWWRRNSEGVLNPVPPCVWGNGGAQNTQNAHGRIVFTAGLR